MAKTTSFIVVAGLSVALAFVVTSRVRRVHQTTPPSDVRQGIKLYGPIVQLDRRAGSHGSALTGLAAAPVDDVTEGPPKSDFTYYESGNPRGITLDKSDSKPLASKPFPLSASIRSKCLQMGKDCNELQLHRFAEEPRDSVWAPEMEAKLRDLARSDPMGSYTVRNVECRTTICAMEVASPGGPYFGSIDVTSPLYRQISSGIEINAYETHPDSVKITVTLKIFVRRN